MPTEEAVERRAILKRQGRTERKLFWYTVGQTAFIGLLYALPQAVGWAADHKEMAGGLVGLLGIIGGGIALAFRLRPPPRDAPPSEGPPS